MPERDLNIPPVVVDVLAEVKTLSKVDREILLLCIAAYEAGKANATTQAVS